MKKTAISVDLPDELRNRIREVSKTHKMTETLVVRLGLEIGLPAAEERIKALRAPVVLVAATNNKRRTGS